MKKKIIIFLVLIFVLLTASVSTVFAGPASNSPYQINIDDESILEDDPDFFENPPLWQLKSYSVYPFLQRNKLNNALKVIKFKAVFEYKGDTLPEEIIERPLIGTATCKVPNPYYFNETKIIYKGFLPLNSGKRVSVTVLMPFPVKFAAQLRKNPATCNVAVESENGFPIQYSFEVRRVGREFEMVFQGTNTDQAPPLEDNMPGLPEKTYTMPTEARCRELRLWYSQGVLTQTLGGNLSEPVACNKYYPALWGGSNATPTTTPTPPTTPILLPAASEVKIPPTVTAADHIRGQIGAPVTLIEYSDPECPYCQMFHPTMKKILAAYSGKVRWVYRHFPLNFHEHAEKKAEASECVNELGGASAFWEFTDRLLEMKPDAADLLAHAEALGLDKQLFISCLQSGKYKKLVSEHIQGGVLSGVNGTPSTFILGPNGFTAFVLGAQGYETVAQEVERALAR